MTLLKKRLFSSPAAFLRTLEVHRETITRERRPQPPPAPAVLQRLFEDAANSLDGEASEDGVGEAAREAIDAAAAAESSGPTAKELALLDRMIEWAEVMAVREDARTKRLLDWVQEHVKPDSEYTEERVIVFSEYRATQRYLQERLAARGIGGDRVELLDGTTSEDERERIKSQWQEPPADYPVRVLLATDAASEGISLQRHCHLLAHAEIPWNPNRLEQRNGRIDRHGQPAAEVLVHHCVSAGWESASRGSLEGDLDFLARVVSKVEQIREDLGSAGPVIAAQIEEAMLGRRTTLDETRFSGAAASRALLEQERRMRERLAALRDELAESRTTLHLAPDRVRAGGRDRARARSSAAARARDRARDLGGAAADRELGARDDRARAPGAARGAAAGHVRPRACARPYRRRAGASRPSAGADGAGAAARRGVGDRPSPAPRHAPLRRPKLAAPVAVAHGRLVITGASGHRLHEQLIFAGVRLDR